MDTSYYDALIREGMERTRAKRGVKVSKDITDRMREAAEHQRLVEEFFMDMYVPQPEINYQTK